MKKKFQKSVPEFDEVISDDYARDGLESLELPLSRRAFVFIAVLALAISLLVFGRVFFLNFVRGAFYQARSESNVNKEIKLPANRGIIADRFEEVLAENIPSFSVSLDLSEILKDWENLTDTLKKLSEVLELSESEITEIIEKTDLENNNSAIIKRNIPTDKAIVLKSLNLLGVEVVDDYIRNYADGAIFAHILGYTGLAEKNNDVVGKIGLEAYYDSLLRGQDGKKIIYRNANGEELEQKIAEEPRPGYRLETTIDAGLQRYFYNRLRTVLQYLNRDSGVGIAMNPQTGEILSLVSLPSFDGNIFVTSGFDKERKQALAASNKPLFNRAISGIYNPGSTIKPLVALAALKEQVIDPATQIYSSGLLEIPNPYDPEKPSRFLDWKPHGWVDFYSALAKSSNIYFYAVGGGLPRADLAPIRGASAIKGLGIGKLNEYWKKFGFGLKTGVDLPAENSGFLPDPEEKEKRTGQIWRLGDTYNVSIGQGDILVTPLQLLNFITFIANNGKIFRPFLVKRVVDDAQEIQGAVPQEIIDYSDLSGEIKEVQIGLEDAVSQPYGTANLLWDLPLKTAGKTGSAQVANNTRTNAFFVGYGPTEKPQIAILVLIENAREGSLNAVPVARDVLEWYYSNRINN